MQRGDDRCMLMPAGFDLSLPLTNPVHVFGLVMLVILVAPQVLARYEIPGIVVLLVAGLLLGPHAFGVLERGQTMQLLGMVGLLYIMFTAGLEFDLDEFDRHRHRSLIFGTIGFLLPQIIGTLLGRYVLDFEWLTAVLLGSVFASHTLLAYPVLSRMGVARREVVTTTVGATILTDTAALLVLAVVVGAAEGGLTLSFLVVLAALLALYVVAVLAGLPRLGRWFFRHSSGDGTAEYVFVLAAVFVCAAVAEWIGIEAIIGAFLAGLGLNRLVPDHSALMHRVRFVGDALFIPFFLLSTGMLVDAGALVSEARSLIVAGLMLAAVVVTKGLSAWLTGRLFQYDREETIVAFALTIPQAAATLAAVLVGYEVGLFGLDVINGAIIMMLFTCLLGPWLADRVGRKMAARDVREGTAGVLKPQRILVSLANPATTTNLIELAAQIRDPKSGQDLYVVAIARDGPDVAESVRHAESIVGQAGERAAAADVPVRSITRVEVSAAQGIRRAIQETRSTIVMMGWEEMPAAERFIFGGISDHLLKEGDVLLMLCRMQRSVSLTRRLILCVPPLSDHELGFASVVNVTHSLARRARLPIVVVGEASQLAVVEAAMARARASVSLSVRELRAWDDLTDTLVGTIRDDDLVVLVSARRGTLSWRSRLDRLPHSLAVQFPRTDVCVMYPPVEPALTSDDNP